ncbi:MAG TPA: hypothetical protein VGI40_05920 [Pirellulaceae bacterium]|jgi:hypothetical protein
MPRANIRRPKIRGKWRRRLMAMIRHAAQSIEHIWPWWVFGIMLGVAILSLFGLFEEKRTDVLLLIGRLS